MVGIKCIVSRDATQDPDLLWEFLNVLQDSALHGKETLMKNLLLRPEDIRRIGKIILCNRT